MDATILMAACTSSVGAFALWASLTNQDVLFRSRSLAYAERRWGRDKARTAVATVGSGLLLLAASYWVFP
ncbi:MAG: hypothetical protein WD045_04330 [Pirellulaceae bacterium]